MCEICKHVSLLTPSWNTTAIACMWFKSVFRTNDCHKYTSQADRTISNLKSGDTSSSPLHIHIETNMASAAEKRMLTAPNSKLANAKVDLAVSSQLQRISRAR